MVMAGVPEWRLCLLCGHPCSGAILVLLFSKVIGVFAWGVASALAMALGTAITLSVLALLVFFCRRVIERMGRSRAPTLWQQTAWSTLSLAGGMVLLTCHYRWYPSVLLTCLILVFLSEHA